MYPGVIVEYDDQSNISSLVSATEVRNRPLFAALFTSDKGTEEWTRCTKDNFFKIYGKNISFAKHGQPLLQAAMTVNAGGELLCKRLVSSDASLANLGITATIVDTEIQDTDEVGKPLWKLEGGGQTTDRESSTGVAVMRSVTGVKYMTMGAQNVKTIEEAETAITKKIQDDNMENTHLLFVIADTGRGDSKKRVKILPNYKVSKNLGYTQYVLSIIEGTETTESIAFAANPDMIVNGYNQSMTSMVNSNSNQVICSMKSNGMESFITALAAKLGVSEDDLYAADPLFGCTNKGATPTKYEYVIVTGGSDGENAADLQSNSGISLMNGSNGTFGSSPFTNTTEFAKEACSALDGSFSTDIFNVDQFRINAIVDANYPEEVKRQLEVLAAFREDFVYFRDMGLNVNSMDAIITGSNKEAKNMFCASYFQSYDIIDPYSKKQITVTIGYDLAQLLVNHWNNGSIMPTAGIKHNMVIKNAIYGTLSFSPIICPDPRGNQKETLEDMRVNYATYIDNQLVIESLYTSQPEYTQWSFINNVMGIQDVIKAIRMRCPIVRYSFIEADDLEKYRSDVEEVIAPYRSNFSSLELDYVEDANYAANKIFYAVLNVKYKDFVQTEQFKVTALSSVEGTATN